MYQCVVAASAFVAVAEYAHRAVARKEVRDLALIWAVGGQWEASEVQLRPTAIHIHQEAGAAARGGWHGRLVQCKLGPPQYHQNEPA